MKNKTPARKGRTVKRAAKAAPVRLISPGQAEAEDNHAEQQGRAQLRSIVEMVAALRAASESQDDTAREQAEQAIHEDPLSVQTRSGWRTPGAKPEADEEFEILLCTGGPACRIIGTLTEHAEPDTARIEFQDWGTPWTTLRGVSADEETAVLDYCRTFYFGQ